MAKKSNVMEKPQVDRIAKARREGRTQQALELAREQYKHDKSEANRELVRQVSLERGLQLQTQGARKDAAIVYANLLPMGGTPEFLADVAQRLAACGQPAQALQAAAQFPEAIRQRIMHHAVDAAVAQGPAGKQSIPAELHGAFDALLLAFAHYEAGRDDEARTVLQGIGLQSPFLEWKVLLRGLIAYSTNDDTRALENWQRLDANRLPYRLSVSARASIDPDFMRVQPEATQQMLRMQIMQQQGVTIASALREVRGLLPKDNLGPAFRKLESVLPGMKKECPEFVHRLAQCFAWAVIDHGQPEDIERYLRVFGSPADDPQINRLQALALELRGLWPEAHQAWQNFLGHVQKSPQLWPGESSPRVQALVWARMAENANPAIQRRSKSGNPFFDLFARQTKPLKPNAEECYEKAIALAPDRLESYLALFNVYFNAHKNAKAKKIGNELIKRFPNHAETLEVLGEMSLENGAYKQAQDYFEKAIRANPLDRRMRGRLAQAHQYLGLKYTLDGKHARAGEHFEKALPMIDGSKTSALCLWAAAEWSANNQARAVELIAQAMAEPNHRLACRYALMGASVRAKLPAKDKKRIAGDFKAALKDAPTAAEILVLIESAAHERDMHDETFHGQQSNEKAILKFLKSIDYTEFDDAQLERLCTGLASLRAGRLLYNTLQHATFKHPKNPFFRLGLAEFHLLDNSRQPNMYRARANIDLARKLVEEMPRGELQQQYLERIKDCEQAYEEISAGQRGMFDVLNDLMDAFPGDPFDDDEEDEEDWN